MILIETINRYGTTLAYNHDNVLLAKSCGKCNDLKPLNDFHKTNRCKLTLTVSTCKSCIKVFHNQKYRKWTTTFQSKYDENGNPTSRECSKCSNFLPIENFYFHKKGKDGISSSCMECTSSEGKEYRTRESHKIKERSQKYYTQNKDKVKITNSVKRYTQRKQKLFYSNFYSELQKIYTSALEINSSGESVAVDHIIPLIHPNVCGLHYPENLKIVPDSYNCSKGNKWDGTRENENWQTEWRNTRKRI